MHVLAHCEKVAAEFGERTTPCVAVRFYLSLSLIVCVSISTYLSRYCIFICTGDGEACDRDVGRGC